MPHVIHWCSFAGAWLLVIGPLYQGATELDEETQERGDLVAKLRALPHADPPSPWWSLHEAYQWAEWAFWTLIVAISVICATPTSYRTRRRRDRRRNAG